MQQKLIGEPCSVGMRGHHWLRKAVSEVTVEPWIDVLRVAECIIKTKGKRIAEQAVRCDGWLWPCRSMQWRGDREYGLPTEAEMSAEGAGVACVEQAGLALGVLERASPML